MENPPSKRQLAYLKSLGYRGPAPRTATEASEAIKRTQRKQTPAQKAKTAERLKKNAEKDAARQRREQLREVKAQIAEMIRENKGDPQPYYLGFRAVPFDEDDISDADRPYLNTFIPLDVAKQFPEIMVCETIEWEEVMESDMVPLDMKIVRGPGIIVDRPKPKPSAGCAGMVAIFVTISAAIATTLLGERFLG